jgi:hypothetical protein
MKRVIIEASKIAPLETTFIDTVLTWYMKCKATVPVGQARSLTKKNIYLHREFQNPKSESKCMTQIKEITQQVGETMWDYDKWFKLLLDRLMF